MPYLVPYVARFAITYETPPPFCSSVSYFIPNLDPSAANLYAVVLV